MKKNLIIYLTMAVMVITTASCLAEESTSLASYLEQALVGNDDLRAAQAEFRAGTERVRQAGVLPDPKLSVQYYLQPVETRTGPQNGAIGLSQAIPWFGKLSLLHEFSDHEAAIYRL